MSALMEMAMMSKVHNIKSVNLVLFHFSRCDSLNNSSSTEKFYKSPCMAGRKEWHGM